MKRKTLTKILAIILVLSMTLCACSSGGANTQDTTKSGSEQKTTEVSVIKSELKVALNGEPSNLDPQNNTELNAWAVQEEIYDKLIQKDSEGNFIADIATKWEIIDDTTTRFYLREDVNFSNGEKLTAEDVKFTLQRATTQNGSKSFFSTIDTEGITVVDDYTIDVKTTEPFAPLLAYLSSARGAILCKSALESMGDEAYGRNPIGSGPYALSEWSTGENIILEKRSDYWGEAGVSKTITFKFITEASTRAIELETGAVDAIYAVAETDTKRIEENQDLVLLSGPSYQIVYFTFDMDDAIVGNLKVRQAMAKAIDMKAVVDAVYGNSADVADGVMSPNVFGYKSIGVTEYDLEGAKALLSEAGYGDGITLSLKLDDNSSYKSIAEIVQNMWKQIGINVEITILDHATFESQKAAGEVQVGIGSSNAASGDPDHMFSGWLVGIGYEARPFDEKILEFKSAGKVEYDDAKRIEIYGELQQYIYDNLYMAPIAFSKVVYGVTSKVENFECNPGRTPDLSKVTVYE